MTPAQLVRTCRRSLGLSANGFADALGVNSDRTVRRWEAGTKDIPGPVIVLCRIWNWPGCPQEIKPRLTPGDASHLFESTLKEMQRRTK